MVTLLLLVDILASSLAPIKISPNFLKLLRQRGLTTAEVTLQLGTHMRDFQCGMQICLNFRILVAAYVCLHVQIYPNLET